MRFVIVLLALILSCANVGMAEPVDPLIKVSGIHTSKDITIAQLGVISKSGHEYTIFNYRWDWNNGSEAKRVTKRLLIFKDGEYLGNYHITGLSCDHIKANVIFCSKSRKDAGTIAIINEGPPKNILLDGEPKSLDTEKDYLVANSLNQ